MGIRLLAFSSYQKGLGIGRTGQDQSQNLSQRFEPVFGKVAPKYSGLIYELLVLRALFLSTAF
jgi:hypothetical protein